MKFLVHAVVGSLFLQPSLLGGQTVPVDWLVPTENVDGRFLLLNQSSDSIAEAEFAAVVGFPLEAGVMEQYDESRWQESALVPENDGGTKSVDGFRVRVAPFGGVPDWSLSVMMQVPGDWYFAVGSLYHDSSNSHGPMGIVASQGGGTLPIDFLGVSGWDGGAGSLQGDLDWNMAAGELIPDSGNDGESGMAFFRVSNFGGNASEITFTMPNGFAAGAAGDDVVFAIGHAAPEPSAMAFCLLAPLILGRRRK